MFIFVTIPYDSGEWMVFCLIKLRIGGPASYMTYMPWIQKTEVRRRRYASTILLKGNLSSLTKPNIESNFNSKPRAVACEMTSHLFEFFYHTCLNNVRIFVTSTDLLITFSSCYHFIPFFFFIIDAPSSRYRSRYVTWWCRSG